MIAQWTSSRVHSVRRLPRRSALLLLALCLLCCEHGVSQQQPDEIADTTRGARVGLLPLPILYYTPETGIAGGGAILLSHRANASDQAARPSSVMLDVIYTQKKQIIAEIYPDIYLAQGTYHIIGSVCYSKYPLKFYGIGNETPESLEEPYTSRPFRVSLDVLRRIAGPFSAGISMLYEKRSLVELQPDGLLAAGTISGSRGGTTLGVGGVIHWDTRDNIFLPAAGRYYLVSLRTTAHVMANDFSFSYFTMDLREYLGITETSTLAVQALATFTAGNVPFYMLAQLGGSNIMRGYYEGRYRDKQLLVAQAEYRFPIFWRFGGAAFAGVGNVAPALSRFTLHTIKPSYGFGLRYLFDPIEKMRLRLDVGFGKQTSGLYITANEAL